MCHLIIISLCLYILKQLFTSVFVAVGDIASPLCSLVNIGHHQLSPLENSLYLFLLPPEFDLFLYLTEPGAPRNFKAVAISPNRIKLTWVKPSQSGGIVTGYIINQVQDHNLHNIIYC